MILCVFGSEQIFFKDIFLTSSFCDLSITVLIYNILYITFTLLLAHFAHKSVNYSRHIEFLKYDLKHIKSLLSKENVVDFGILPNA